MTTGKRLLAKVAPFADMVRGIAHPHRIAIVYLLAHDPLWIKDLKNHLGIPQNLVSHHVKQMMKAGWLKKERIGKHVEYSLNEKIFKEIPKLLEETPLYRNKK